MPTLTPNSRAIFGQEKPAISVTRNEQQACFSFDPLRELLARLHNLESNPVAGPILRSVTGKPLNLDMLANCTIVPALSNPENYSSPDKQLIWHGYYAFRRGIATLTSSVSRDPMAAKGLLRHSSVNTTLTHYIKDVPEVTENAMTLVEELFKPVAPEEVQQLVFDVIRLG